MFKFWIHVKAPTLRKIKNKISFLHWSFKIKLYFICLNLIRFGFIFVLQVQVKYEKFLGLFNYDISPRLHNWLQRYISALQDSLNLLRLTIAAHKCSFTIYLGKLPLLIKDQTLFLTLYIEKIPLDHNPK